MTRLFIPVKINGSFKDNLKLNFNNIFVERRFGRSPFYLLADLETQNWKLIENTNHHFGGSDTPASIAFKFDADFVLASHMGYGPYVAFRNVNIPILQVNSEKPLGTLLKEFDISKYQQMEIPARGSCCSGAQN
ncbi:MAG: NifB/NifX family molybdenum-iron cluster-binding protein [Candidatus Kariarchaeaceae archaeon]|jgi:predicted Fe-Mo cluster-binding NifX family protein